MTLLITIIIASLAIMGVSYAMEFDLDENRKPVNKELLWFVKYYTLVVLNRCMLSYFAKPLVLCTICMASVWGSAVYLLLTPEIKPIEWVVTVAAVAGLNRLISAILHK